MKYKYSVKSNNGMVSGTSLNYNDALIEAKRIMEIIHPSAILSEKLNDLVAEPNYLVYELGDDFVYMKIEKYEE